MKKTKCPVCGQEIYMSGNYMAEVENECIIFDDNGDQFVSDKGEVVSGRRIKTQNDLACYAIVHSIHPCSFWRNSCDC